MQTLWWCSERVHAYEPTTLRSFWAVLIRFCHYAAHTCWIYLGSACEPLCKACTRKHWNNCAGNGSSSLMRKLYVRLIYMRVCAC